MAAAPSVCALEGGCGQVESWAGHVAWTEHAECAEHVVLDH